MSFNQQEFNSFIIENNVIGFFDSPIQLKSGRMSNWYVNWRNISQDVYLMDKLTDYILAFTKDQHLNPDCFYGVPEGATKLGILCQYKWAKVSPHYVQGSHCFPMGRAKPKDHGAPKDRYFIGEPKGKLIVIEDVTTTGGSLLTTIAQFKQTQVEIIAALGLTNRMEVRDDGRSVQKAVEDEGVKYLALSNGLELLPIVYNTLNPGKEIAASIESEFQKYGVKSLTLA